MEYQIPLSGISDSTLPGWVLLTYMKSGISDSTLPGWVLLTYMILAGTIVPYLCVLNGIRFISASQASLIGMLEPVIAGFLAWFALSEQLAPIQLIGGAIVLAGIYLAEKARKHTRN